MWLNCTKRAAERSVRITHWGQLKSTEHKAMMTLKSHSDRQPALSVLESQKLLWHVTTVRNLSLHARESVSSISYLHQTKDWSSKSSPNSCSSLLHASIPAAESGNCCDDCHKRFKLRTDAPTISGALQPRLELPLLSKAISQASRTHEPASSAKQKLLWHVTTIVFWRDNPLRKRCCVLSYGNRFWRDN